MPPVPGDPQRRARGRRGPRRGPAAGAGARAGPAPVRPAGAARGRRVDLRPRARPAGPRARHGRPATCCGCPACSTSRRSGRSTTSATGPTSRTARSCRPPTRGWSRARCRAASSPAARRRHPGAPPVPLVLDQRAALHRAGRRRPERAGHQADALPHQRRLPDRRRADRRRRRRQAGGGAGRGEGPVRRGGQHRLGPDAGAGRLPRRLRPGRPQDALQDRAGGAPGGQPDPALLPHRHRQLPPEDRPAVRGLRHAHRRPGGRRRPDRPVQRADRLQPADRVPPAAGRAARRPQRASSSGSSGRSRTPALGGRAWSRSRSTRWSTRRSSTRSTGPPRPACRST